MTTTFTLRNHATSNGDIAFTRRAPSHITRQTVAPGCALTATVSPNEDLEFTEFWPQSSPPAAPFQKTGEYVDSLIEREVNVQIAMWGTNRPDNDKGQLLGAAMASAGAINTIRSVPHPLSAADRALVFEQAKMFYPADWDPTAFRDYGSDVANLIVAIAFLRNQVLDMVSKGEDTTRSKRGQPYTNVRPMITAQQAGAST